LSTLSLNLLIGGGRNVTSVQMPAFPSADITLLDGQATVSLNLANQLPNQNIDLNYTLAMENLGAITFSSFVQSELVPDDLGDGFFLSVIEPEPSVDVIQKYFTFVMDRSSLMSGSSIDQAKLAAEYMVENLNPGDYFNIVDFNTVANAFALIHVPFNAVNMNLALSYIGNMEASGMCNISAAFDTAIPQFASAPPDVANIIVFLSKGMPNVGIQNIDALVAHVNNLVTATGRMLNIFCFGVGSEVNPILLSQIAADNGGSATWVGISDLGEVLIDFYSKIRNPVLLNPTLTIDQSSSPVTEVYPVSIPNLYLGTQMLLCGRYAASSTSLTFDLEGNALGSITNYHFKSDLSSEAVDENVFLMKIWAKMKIEHLMGLYDQMNPNSTEAQALKQEIIDLSVAYGVLCRFTSFSSDDDPDIDTEDDIQNVDVQSPALFRLLGNYPNPFNPSTTIRFELKTPTGESFCLKIYNNRGQLIRVLYLEAQNPGIYSFHWDGLDADSAVMPSGVYFYTVSSGKERHLGKMLLLK
jgi:Ca-activated chloride channel family protein